MIKLKLYPYCHGMIYRDRKVNRTLWATFNNCFILKLIVFFRQMSRLGYSLFIDLSLSVIQLLFLFLSHDFLSLHDQININLKVLPGYSQSKSRPSKLCFLRNTTTLSTNVFLSIYAFFFILWTASTPNYRLHTNHNVLVLLTRWA